MRQQHDADNDAASEKTDVFYYEEWSVSLEEWIPCRRLATKERLQELIPARIVGSPRRVNTSELDNGWWPSSPPAGPDMSPSVADGNGILSQIPGQYVAAAIDLMPDATVSPSETAEAELDVPGFGRVRFHARRLDTSARHSQSGSRFWSVTRAVPVIPSAP